MGGNEVMGRAPLSGWNRTGCGVRRGTLATGSLCEDVLEKVSLELLHLLILGWRRGRAQ